MNSIDLSRRWERRWKDGDRSEGTSWGEAQLVSKRWNKTRLGTWCGVGVEVGLESSYQQRRKWKLWCQRQTGSIEGRRKGTVEKVSNLNILVGSWLDGSSNVIADGCSCRGEKVVGVVDFIIDGITRNRKRRKLLEEMKCRLREEEKNSLPIPVGTKVKRTHLNLDGSILPTLQMGVVVRGEDGFKLEAWVVIRHFGKELIHTVHYRQRKLHDNFCAHYFDFGVILIWLLLILLMIFNDTRPCCSG